MVDTSSLPPVLELADDTPGSLAVARTDERVLIKVGDDLVASCAAVGWEHYAPFAIHLTQTRLRRGLLSAANPVQLSPVRGGNDVLGLELPHFWSQAGSPGIEVVWEDLASERAIDVLGVSVEVATRWASRAEDLRLLLRECRRQPPGAATYLSFKWIVNHEIEIAQALTSTTCRLDHVSLHVAPDELEPLATILETVGLIRVSRPGSVEQAVAGAWLVAGNSMLHLNARTPDPTKQHPLPTGTAPNHVCLVTDSFAERCETLRQTGIQLVAGGSIGNQVWFSIRSGVTIELQPTQGASDRVGNNT